MGKFTAVEHEIMDAPAARVLGATSRSLLFEVLRAVKAEAGIFTFEGETPRPIVFTPGSLSWGGLTRHTFYRGVADLERHGFIRTIPTAIGKANMIEWSWNFQTYTLTEAEEGQIATRKIEADRRYSPAPFPGKTQVKRVSAPGRNSTTPLDQNDHTFAPNLDQNDPVKSTLVLKDKRNVSGKTFDLHLDKDLSDRVRDGESKVLDEIASGSLNDDQARRVIDSVKASVRSEQRSRDKAKAPPPTPAFKEVADEMISRAEAQNAPSRRRSRTEAPKEPLFREGGGWRPLTRDNRRSIVQRIIKMTGDPESQWNWVLLVNRMCKTEGGEGELLEILDQTQKEFNEDGDRDKKYRARNRGAILTAELRGTCENLKIDLSPRSVAA